MTLIQFKFKNIYFVAILISAFAIVGCTQINDFPMGESHYQIKQVQILDPEAPERNDGIILSLDGTYGQKVMQSYRGSSVAPATAKGIGSISSGGSN
ncbi:hypothetical protein L2747_00815 [Shewanella marinintestina]|uniref:hypothetical protein n=1 Tax=Shewanella marinintestina TaxID=190305 RepID=UPI00200F4238|nr:hypothetical protein [Shewanella marinintestina]MCL1144561.1 hypothetical protein [Shewanella marinintestina]